MMNTIDNIITSVENGLFAVLGEAPKPARKSARSASRKAVKKSISKSRKKVRKKRK